MVRALGEEIYGVFMLGAMKLLSLIIKRQAKYHDKNGPIMSYFN